MAELSPFGSQPLGFPITCTARIRPIIKGDKFNTDEKVTKDGKKIIIGLTEKDSYEFDYVYGNDATSENIFERDVDRFLKTVMQGYNGAVLILGESNSGKTYTCEGNIQSMNGLIPISVRQLFFQLREKVKIAEINKSQLRNALQPQNSFQISMQFYEVFNDQIHDLLDPSQSEFKIEYSEYGVVVPNLSSRLVRDENDFLRLYYQAVANRTSASCEFGLLSTRASCFLTLDILQIFGGRNERSWAKMSFIELPGTEKLMEDPNQLRAREGTTLNKEIIAVGSLIRALSNETQIDYANYNQSKTTMFMEEILGGNCVTICIATLSPDIYTSRITLQYAQLIKNISNYPIINEERIQGLLRKNRLKIFHLREELHVAETMAEEKIFATATAAESKLVEIQGRLVTCEEEKFKLSEEKRKLYSMYMEFRSKYSALVESKTKFQADLIASEEERLNVTKLLIDIQIESNEIKEQFANEKFQLETRMLNMESEYAEHSAREQKHMDEKRGLQKELESVSLEKKDLELEFVSLKQNYIHMSEDMKTETTKAEKVAVEMLNLINAKSTLESENQKLQLEFSRLQSRYDDLAGSQLNSTSERGVLLQQLTEAKSLNERNFLELIKKDVEMKNMENEFESKKTSLEKTYIEYTRDKEQEFITLRASADKEQKKLFELSRDFELERKNFEAEIRSLKRLLSENEAANQDSNTKNQALMKEVDNLKLKAAKTSEQYRSKLLQYMNEVTDLSSSLQPNSDQRSSSVLSNVSVKGNSAFDLQPAFDKMYKEVLKAYRDREAEITEELEAEKKAALAVTRKLKSLTNQYRLIRDHLVDIEPSAVTNKIILNDEDLKNVQEEVLQTDKRRELEVQTVQARLTATESELAQAKEELLKIVDSHSKSMTVAAKNYSLLHDEVVNLRKMQEKFEPLTMNLRGEHDKSLTQIKDMQREFKEQLESIAAPRMGSEVATIKDTNERLRKENSSLREENRRLRDENSSLQADYADARANSGISLSSNTNANANNLNKQILVLRKEKSNLMSEVEDLRTRLKKASENPAPASKSDDSKGPKPDKASLQEFEKERANMRARTTQAEEELKNFQDTFTSEMMKKETLIAKLKQEVQFWKAKAGG